ncbi:MAG TPA: hypothetical protein VLC55_12490 [Burkholderiales bacterium]|nr:hypothetical protein [Burkholderiales bacterium]
MKWILSILCAALAAQPVLAQQKPQSKPTAVLRKCVDEQGVTQYYDKNPPPGCQDKEITEMSTKGVPKKTISAPPTEEEKKAKADDAARKVEEDKLRKEQDRKDKALLDTYTTEKEIDLARERNLQATEATLKNTELRLKSAQGRLDQYSKQADNLTKQGKAVPDHLQEDLNGSKKEVAKLQDELVQKQKEREAIKARFEADKLRFRELRAKSPENFQPASQGAAAPAQKK